MFSVNNFYDFLDSHYGRRKSDTILMKFNNDGSRHFKDLVAVSDSYEISGNHVKGFAILHDQETFDYQYINTYRHWLSEDRKQKLWLDLTTEEVFTNYSLSRSWPILCHSEKNSPDIKWAVDLGTIDCHYFWHGLISRDWYRHWKHHADLQCRPAAWQQRFLLYARAFDGTRAYRKTLVKHLSSIKNHVRYNWENSNIVGSDYSAKITVQDAQETAIHIVAETLFDTEKIHLTEKIFKSIVMRQPFIVFGAKGTLQYLKDYGFRTFDHIWDESYDSESNHDVRMTKGIDVIKQLANMSADEFSRVIAQCQDTVEYNRRYFFSDDFEKVMLDELHSNWRTALEQQSHLLESDPGGSLFWTINQIVSRGGALPDRIWFQLKKILDKKLIDDATMSRIKQQYSWVDQVACFGKL